MNIIAFIPAALLGAIGGILGAVFTFINLKIARARKRLLAKVSQQKLQRIIRMMEPITIMVSASRIFIISLRIIYNGTHTAQTFRVSVQQNSIQPVRVRIYRDF